MCPRKLQTAREKKLQKWARKNFPPEKKPQKNTKNRFLGHFSFSRVKKKPWNQMDPQPKGFALTPGRIKQLNKSKPFLTDIIPLANINFFLSVRRKKFYKNFPFCQLLYLLHLFVNYFIYSSELIRGLLKRFANPRVGLTNPRVQPNRGFANPRVDLGIFIHKSPSGFPFTNPLKSAISGLEKNIIQNYFLNRRSVDI